MRSSSSIIMLALAACLAVSGCEGPGQDITATDGKSPERGKNQEHLSGICTHAFPGITSCPIGTASLTYEEASGTLTASNFSDNGASGFSSNFSDATSWRQEMTPDIPEGGYLNLAAKSEGEVVSTFRLTHNEGNTVSAAPTFTGSAGSFKYRADFYIGDELVGSLDDLDAGDGPTYLISGGYTNGCWATRMEFRGPQCGWIWVPYWQSPCRRPLFELTDQISVEADRVEFTEVISDGQYPYRNFQSIEATGILDLYTVTQEAVSE